MLKHLPRDEPVPAISLRQPWAAAVVWLDKDIEDRSSWLYKYRGPILIHASATPFSTENLARMHQIARADGWQDEELASFTPDRLDDGFLTQGAIVGVARLVHVFGPEDEIPEDHPAYGSPWDADAPYLLHLEDAVPCIPVQWKGRVGLFKIPYEIAKGLRPVPITDE